MYNRRVPAQPPAPRRAPRSEPREITELRAVKASQPDLADAVDLQVELLTLQRRVQSRIPLPWFEIDTDWLKRQFDDGQPLLRFAEIPLDWTELRLMFRQTADILLRYRAIEADDHAQMQTIARTANTLEPLVAAWYTAAQVPGGANEALSLPAEVNPDTFAQVLALGMRPFLERCAESIQQRFDLGSWTQPYCPVCGGEVEFAVITPGAERHLICSRCSARWRFDAIACPFCRNADRLRITSFTSRDGRYRLYACDVCTRYLKAYDGRSAARPLLLAVDTIATLPLDAAAIKKGYRS